MFSPIGYFHTNARFTYDVPRQGSLATGNAGIVQLDECYRGTLADLNGFERIWLLFLFDRTKGAWHPKVMPPRHVTRKVGLFASRSPYRPNPIGLSCVKLLAVDEAHLTLAIAEHDLIDGTPIIDIKPYLPYADAFPDAKAGWTESPEQSYAISYSPKAETQLSWLASHGVECITAFINDRLGTTPLNRKRNRLIADPQSSTNTPLLAYRTWRVRFICDETTHAVTITDILSGYSPDDLTLNSTDKYHDKAIHREFIQHFPINL